MRLAIAKRLRVVGEVGLILIAHAALGFDNACIRLAKALEGAK